MSLTTPGICFICDLPYAGPPGNQFCADSHHVERSPSGGWMRGSATPIGDHQSITGAPAMTIDPSTPGDNATPPSDRLDAAALAAIEWAMRDSGAAIARYLEPEKLAQYSGWLQACRDIDALLRELRATQRDLQVSRAEVNLRERGYEGARAAMIAEYDARIEAERRLAVAEDVLTNNFLLDVYRDRLAGEGTRQ